METGKVAEFLRYVNKEILPATNDLENLDEKNRKHVQKLVYTNLVSSVRFLNRRPSLWTIVDVNF